MATPTNLPSPVETIKNTSHRLRGTLLESLADPVTGAIAEDDTQLIKFHGSYQQDDRDLREERRLQKLEPAYQFMIRTRLPGGVATPAQWLQLDCIATRYANASLRITTRQTFQLHGIIKKNLKTTLQQINAAMLDTIAACGDVNRNVIVAANPLQSRAHAALYATAKSLAAHLLPKTRAYYEIWLDEKQVAGSGAEEEALYGATYLPRKFKIAFAIGPYNDVDVFANDLGFIAIVEQGNVIGYNVVAGGGMGATHAEPDTYPRLASMLGYVEAQHVVAITEAVLTTQRDFGNRSNRKRARLKYTIDDRGIDWFKAEVERRANCTFAAPRPFSFEHNGDRFGWTRGEDGNEHLTLRIEAGRIIDRPGAKHLTGLREIAAIHRGEFRLTPNQNLVIAGIEPALRAQIQSLVSAHALDGYRQATPTRLRALACVALPTCALAMAEAERYLPQLLSKIENLLEQHGLREVPISLRVSGCPNGCSRPYLGEIALIGKAPGRYNLMLGADASGQRLNRLYRENIDETQILENLGLLFARFAAERGDNEGFGDFLVRSAILTTQKPSLPRIALEMTT